MVWELGLKCRKRYVYVDIDSGSEAMSNKQ